MELAGRLDWTGEWKGERGRVLRGGSGVQSSGCENGGRCGPAMEGGGGGLGPRMEGLGEGRAIERLGADLANQKCLPWGTV